MSIKFSELKKLEEIGIVEQEPMSAIDVATTAITNIPSSGLQYAKDIITPLLDPVGTAKSIGELGLGLVQLAIPGQQANEEQAKAVGEYFAKRYGGIENIKKTIAKDPIGFMGDASVLLTGGASIITKTGKLKKTAEKAKKIGQAIDPITGKITQKMVGKPIAEILSTMTGVGREAIEQAYISGATGGVKAKEFTEALRGKVAMEDIVSEARKGVRKMADKRRSEYLRSMEGIKESQRKIDFDPILNEVDNVRKKFEFRGKTLLDKPGLNKLQEIEETILDWSMNKEFHTIEGLDALKKKIDNLYPETDVFGKTAGKSAAVVEQMRGFINKQIKDISPEYAKTMSAYEQAMRLEKEIRKSLSMGDNVSADTSTRKLLSVMRNNANTNFGMRLDNLKKLEEIGGVSLRPTVAGTALSQATPRGIQRALLPYAGVAGVAGGISLGFSPAYAAFLAASSPRLVGETAYMAGKALPKATTTRQIGAITEEAQKPKDQTNNQTFQLLKSLLK